MEIENEIVDKETGDGSEQFGIDQIRLLADAWKASVVDYSKRNRLLYFQESGLTLRLLEIPKLGQALQGLLDGESVNPVNLIDFDPNEAHDSQKVLSKLIRKQNHSVEEFGISPLYLTFGTCSWEDSATTSGEKRMTRSPILLLNISLNQKTKTSWGLEPIGQPKINSVLVHAAEKSGVTWIAEAINRISEIRSISDLESALSGIYNCLGVLEKVSFSAETHLGSFAYQDEAIYRELSDTKHLMRSEIVRALGGESAASKKIAGQEMVDLGFGDRLEPKNENLILDADSSQMRAIYSAIQGKHVVLEGPPGTGKSQTIANMIAESIAKGKTVLFVAQKRAAITAVLSRLEAHNLQNLVLDVHNVRNSKMVAQHIKSSFENMKTAKEVSNQSIHDAVFANREKLIAVKNRLTEPVEFGRSLAQHIADSLAPSPNGVNLVKLPITESHSLVDEDLYVTALESFEELATIGAFSPAWNSRGDIWNFEKVTTKHLIEEIRGVSKSVIDKLSSHEDLPLNTWLSSSKYQTSEDWLSRVTPKLVGKKFSSHIFSLLAGEDSNAERTWGEKIHDWVGQKKINSQLSGLNDKDRATTLLAILWQSGKINTQLTELAMKRLEPKTDIWHVAQVERLAGLLPEKYDWPMNLSEFLAAISSISTSRNVFLTARRYDLVEQIMKAGLEGLIAPLSEHPFTELSPEEHKGFVRQCIASSVVEEHHMSDAVMQGFDGEQLENIRSKFSRNDKDLLKSNGERISRLSAERFKNALDSHPEQSQLLIREANKSRSHKSLRYMIEKAPDLMLVANPVWAMSPVQVAQTVPKNTQFDLVIFDEASQVRPEIAIPALIRGRTVVIAGDSNQLPPTNFFSSSAFEDQIDDYEQVSDSESILEAMERVVGNNRHRLMWHYRSRDERLIAVSNREIYGNSLVTYPGSDTPDAVRHILVEGGTHSPVANKESNAPILEKVIEEIIDHVNQRPEESLGVITFGVKQMNELEMMLQRAKSQNAALSQWIDSQTVEPFFVKNIERVQGDERDSVILVMSYGKDQNGKMSMRWGPILSEGGKRRLNVAISRAKRRMTLMTTFTLEELQKQKITPGTGVELFKQFLEFMANSGEHYQTTSTEDVLNPFELDVKNKLEDAGLQIVPQFGVGSYKIDFAVRHPSKQNNFVLAIEADGASYHSSYTSRERDRLRQELLERRGWKFHRIWSTDWFFDSQKETEKILEVYREVLSNEKNPVRASPGETKDSSVRESSPRRAQKPSVAQGIPISERNTTDIKQVIRYINSDNAVRTRDEQLREARELLGYARQGKRINEAIMDVILRHEQGRR